MVQSEQFIKDLARWEHIFSSQCAYRSTSPLMDKPKCKHLFTNTSECSFQGCPIVQTQFVGFQRDADSILLISKNSKAKKYLDTWNFETLPENKAEAEKKVKNAMKIMNKTTADDALKKFEYLYQITETIRQAESTESDDDDLDLD